MNQCRICSLKPFENRSAKRSLALLSEFLRTPQLASDYDELKFLDIFLQMWVSLRILYGSRIKLSKAKNMHLEWY